MALACLSCTSQNETSGNNPKIVRFGFFFRKSDRAVIQRFRCRGCERSFSHATNDVCVKQHKRRLNKHVAALLVSGVSQRRAAKVLGVNRKTIVRKFIFLGQLAARHLKESNLTFSPAQTVEFDDLETIEHTKLKPLSVTLAVEHKTRRILGFRVSQMPAKGHLSRISFQKYGRRADKRIQGRRELFTEIQPLIRREALIKSDENPHYPRDVKRYFPAATHETHKGRRGCVAGQGELKKIGFDPLFSLNHTCAMLRANINRLFRRTWCTTKIPERLTLHLALYAVFHNENLK